MSDTLVSTDIETFNQMFAQLGGQESHLCWIRSLDYQRQLYLSPQFETIYESPVTTLYDAPESWYDFLSVRDKKDMEVIMPKRIQNPVLHDGENVVYYRITTPKGSVRYIKDWSILLKDRQGVYIAVGGIAEQISAEDWYQEQEQDTSTKPTIVLPNGESLMEVLENEKHLHVIQPPSMSKDQGFLIKTLNIDGMRVNLSRRESDCLEHLCMGRSAKETAELLHVSTRTVETHLENIRQKTFCKSKIQLMSYVIRQLSHMRPA